MDGVCLEKSKSITTSIFNAKKEPDKEKLHWKNEYEVGNCGRTKEGLD